jgi:hypothetical protein
MQHERNTPKKGTSETYQLAKYVEHDNNDRDVDEREESETRGRVWEVLVGLSEEARPIAMCWEGGGVETEPHCTGRKRAL